MTEQPEPGKLVSWARLVRAPNCLTAVADVLAGGAIAEAGLGDQAAASLGRVVLAATASACLYGAGCVLNDWADLPKDQIDKKERPLPSGAITPAAAVLATAVLLAAALGLATLAGAATLLVVVAITIVVLLYDLGLKRWPLRGLCMLVLARSGNVALGAVAISGGLPHGVWWLLAPIAMALYVAGLTGMSLFEDRAVGRLRTLAVGLLAPATVVAVVGFSRQWWWAVLPAAWCVATLSWALTRALKAPEPKHFGLYVRAAVLGVPLLGAALALGVGAWGFGGVILGLAVGARVLARRIAT